MTFNEAVKALHNHHENAREEALKAVRKASDQELHFYLVLRDTHSGLAQETRKAIAIAQMEMERRDHIRQRRLIYLTTALSGAVGIVGVILGAWFGSTLS